MNIVEEKWDEILLKMKNEYCSSGIAYNTWIAPLRVYEVNDDTVFIFVSLKASVEHIEEKYALPFKVCIAEVTGIEFHIAFVTEDYNYIKEKKRKERIRFKGQSVECFVGKSKPESKVHF